MFHGKYLFQRLIIKHMNGPLLFADKAFRGLSLQTLQVRHCGLKYPPALTYVKHSITRLWLDHNALTFIPYNYFDGCETLEEIKLNHNNLVVIPNLSYISRKISLINLGQNNISDGTQLYENYFPQLHTVMIGFNNIGTFCMPPRKMWPRVTMLGLAHNSLSIFWLPPWGGLILALEGNPIHCDGAMSWVRRCAKVSQQPGVLRCSHRDHIYDLICDSPKEATGMSPLDSGKLDSHQWKNETK